MFPVTVYPRWRGEHNVHVIRYQLRLGLSPLARGTPCTLAGRERRVRFIPAGAGNTQSSRRRQIILTVYPRWRGEHCSEPRPMTDPGGLSPLARGTRSQDR